MKLRAPVRPVRTLIEGLSFPEGPRWRDGALWFSDIHAHRVCRMTPDGAVVEMARLGDRVSGLGFLPDGRLLIVSMLDRRLVAVGPGGSLEIHADLSELSGHFINDMVVDRQGRAYVGSRNGGEPGSAGDTILLVEPDGRSRIAARNMVSPNGSVVTPDGAFLVVAETALGRLNRFRIEADGSLADREIFANFPGHHIDGICLDAGGGFWAGGGTGGLLRITADGSLAEAIEFPGRMVLACALGGSAGKTLFLATTSSRLLDNLAQVGLDRNLDSEVDSIGRIDAIDVDVPGVGAP